jgi:uncharacterized protein YjhX (UPF0386 family)
MIQTFCAHCRKPLLRPKYRIRARNYCNNNHKLQFEYANDLRDRSTVANAAHEMLRRHGHYKRDNSYLTDKNPATSPSARLKISQAKLEHNWMRGRTGAQHHLYLGGKIWWRGAEWNVIKLRVRKRDAFMCVGCDMTEFQHQEQFGQPLQVDHIIPYRISHDNSSQNLQSLCCYCHGKKKTVELAMIEECRPHLPMAVAA